MLGFGPGEGKGGAITLGGASQIPDPAWTWTGRTLNVITRGDDAKAMTTAIR